MIGVRQFAAPSAAQERALGRRKLVAIIAAAQIVGPQC
jgi:hypothetical protein